MVVIPAINETDFEEVRKKLEIVSSWGGSPVRDTARADAPEGPLGRTVSNGMAWVHLDVADGKFTRNILWNNPKELQASGVMRQVKVEVHLMVENPDEVLDSWLDVKVKRVIVHLESVKDLDVMKMKCVAFGTELFLAIKPDTPVERLFSYEGIADGFLILAVNPGLAGQKFSAEGGSASGGKEGPLAKIKLLRQKFPDVKIEVDGGVNLENALRIKEAGVDILVSASYIWNSEEPKKAYLDLSNI